MHVYHARPIALRRRTLRILLAALLLGVGFASGGIATRAATTINVTTTADEQNADGDCALREAIRAANLDRAVDACPAGSGADTIRLPAGTFKLTRVGSDDNNNAGDLDPMRKLTIIGLGASQTIIDGNQLDRVFDIPSGATLTLRNLTVRNGNVGDSRNGGGILNGGILTVQGSTIAGNAAGQFGRGGGIFNVGTLELRNSLVSENSSLSEGGGITSIGGTVVVYGSTIRNNVARIGGGGIQNMSSSLSVTVSAIRDNTAQLGTGGGIVNHSPLGHDDSPITIANSTISGNFAAQGAGIDSLGQRVTLRNSTVSGNVAKGSGGGIYNSGFTDLPGIVHLYNATIAGNTADSDGDGQGDGGGVINDTFVSGDRMHFYNSILAGNAVGSGETSECRGTLSSHGYNLIGNTIDCTIEGDQTGNLVGVDPLLGPLRNNGGKTQTHALLAGSPAIDAGNPAPPGSGGTACTGRDQRGTTRPRDGNGDGVARCDIGAFER